MPSTTSPRPPTPPQQAAVPPAVDHAAAILARISEGLAGEDDRITFWAAVAELAQRRSNRRLPTVAATQVTEDCGYSQNRAAGDGSDDDSDAGLDRPVYDSDGPGASHPHLHGSVSGRLRLMTTSPLLPDVEPGNRLADYFAAARHQSPPQAATGQTQDVLASESHPEQIQQRPEEVQGQRKRRRRQTGDDDGVHDDDDDEATLREIRALAADDAYLVDAARRINTGRHHTQKAATPEIVAGCVAYFGQLFGAKGSRRLLTRVDEAIVSYGNADLEPSEDARIRPAWTSTLPSSASLDQGGRSSQPQPQSTLSHALELAGHNTGLRRVVAAYHVFRANIFESEALSVNAFTRLVAFYRLWQQVRDDADGSGVGQLPRTSTSVGRGSSSVAVDALCALVASVPIDGSKKYSRARRRIRADISLGALYSDIEQAFSSAVFLLFPPFSDALFRRWGNVVASTVATDIAERVPYTVRACAFIRDAVLNPLGRSLHSRQAYATLLQRELRTRDGRPCVRRIEDVLWRFDGVHSSVPRPLLPLTLD